MSISVSHLTKMYGTQRAVDDISFRTVKGEVVGFLGPNGAGKSTTMKIITGYLHADAGKVEVCGSAVNDYTRSKTGYLPESNPLYNDMFVREYLFFIANLHGLNDKKGKIERIIETVGLEREANKKIGHLSKGYKQRVGLAAALVHDPEVLVLDEPTSGLDPNQIIEIRELIKELGRDKTVLFSSHILQEVEAICDRVIIIDKGKIVADDNLNNLQRTGNGKHYVQVEFREQVESRILNDLKEVTAMVQLQTPAGAGSNFKLETSDPVGLRKHLMQLSLQNDLNIVSLQNESNRLEDIFRSLTSTSIHHQT